SDCPKNWKQVNKYDCIPDNNYKGPCRNIKNFKYFTLSMKKDFEEKCKTKFECNNICEKNYEQECPLNWKVEKGYCLAPDTFDLCKRKKLSIENMTRKEK
ncbi:CPW-WPC family protein, partial [Plasmodium reichenowi]